MGLTCVRNTWFCSGSGTWTVFCECDYWKDWYSIFLLNLIREFSWWAIFGIWSILLLVCIEYNVSLRPKLIKANSLNSVCLVISHALSVLNNIVVDNELNWGIKIVSIGNTNWQQQCALML